MRNEGDQGRSGQEGAGAELRVLSAQSNVPAPIPGPRDGEKPGPAREPPRAAAVKIYGGAEQMRREPHSESSP